MDGGVGMERSEAGTQLRVRLGDGDQAAEIPGGEGGEIGPDVIVAEAEDADVEPGHRHQRPRPASQSHVRAASVTESSTSSSSM